MKFMQLFYILFLFIFLNSNAQKFELGKVSIDELKEKSHPIDTSAVAAILYNTATTKFVYDYKKGFTTIHEYEFRIKIYKKEGLDWATKKVSYYVGYETLNPDVVKFSKGVTYNLVNGQIEKTKLNGEGTFKNNVNDYWSEASITLPNVRVGSVIEYKYTIYSENLVKFPVFNFQYTIPVNFVEYTTDIPVFFIYKSILTGFNRPSSTEKITNGYQNYSNQYNQGLSMNYKQISTYFKAENIEAIKEEPFVDNIDNYKQTVHYELEKTMFPDQPEKDYAQTWEGVTNQIYKDDDFGKQITDNFFLVNDVKTIVGNVDDKLERVKKIFKYVQNKMNWNKFYGYSTEKGVKKAYDEGIGNTAEINFILISMLNLAGIYSDPVLLSTVEHGIPVYPNRTVFNYVIAAVEIDGNRILLDASNKNTTLNVLPFNTINWNGRLIRRDLTSEEINLVPSQQSKKISVSNAIIDKDGNISGTNKNQSNDYFALNFREKYIDLNQDVYLERLEKKYDDIKISDYKRESNASDFSKPIVEEFSFTSNNHAEVIGDKMYFYPMLYFTNYKNQFIQNKRQNPIYFGYPYQEREIISITIPDGYVVESLPKSVSIPSSNNSISFKYVISNTGNKIQLSVIYDVNTAIVPSDYYEELKAVYEEIVKKETEKVVLKKI